uniref:WD_REPEATS_REGION domain-containing protein n=2 Tax=Macrostomum lignano TaxID=282301 RepID=A0A1I8IK71_9PLAT
LQESSSTGNSQQPARHDLPTQAASSDGENLMEQLEQVAGVDCRQQPPVPDEAAMELEDDYDAEDVDGAEDEIDIQIAGGEETDDSNVNSGSRASSRLQLQRSRLRRERLLLGDSSAAECGSSRVDSPAALSADGSIESGRRTRRGFYRIESVETSAGEEGDASADGAAAAAAASASRRSGGAEDIEEVVLEEEQDDDDEEDDSDDEDNSFGRPAAGGGVGGADAGITDREVDACLNWDAPLTHHAGLFGLMRDRHLARPGQWARQVYTCPTVVCHLSLMHTYAAHNGCVNALSFCPFNSDLIASGSDDLNCCLSSVRRKRVLTTGATGHHANVFQCKFISENHVVTASRDGQVRLCHFSPSGDCHTSRLAKHAAACHKLSAAPLFEPHEILSAGEDARVLLIDVRQAGADGPQPAATKLTVVRSPTNRDRVPLYSVHQHPLRPNIYCVCGRDDSVYVFDKRMVMSDPLARLAAPGLLPGTHVTAACFNHTGDCVLASYNDENIHLIEWSTKRVVRTYQGHRNNATVKGVNFYGAHSEYVVSGSDCGYVYLWDTATARLMHSFKADETGIVNVLEPHPQHPILATSGLDNDFKLWQAGCTEQQLTDRESGASARLLRDRVFNNLTERARDARVQPMEPNLLLMLMRQLNRRERRSRHLLRRRRAADGEDDDDDDDDEDEEAGEATDSDMMSDTESDSDGDSGARCIQS